MFPGTVTATLEAAAAGTPVSVPTEYVIGALALLVVGLVARIAYVRTTLPAIAEGGAAH